MGERAGYAVLRRVPVQGLTLSRYRGAGCILMFHRVLPRGPHPLPGGVNSVNTVTDEFLREIVELLHRRGYEIVHVEEAHRRLVAGDRRRFACLTFDDGYRDTWEIVRPLCRELGVPYTVYVMTGQLSGRTVSWWIGLEELVRRHDAVSYRWRGREHRHDTADHGAALAAEEAISRRLREALPEEVDAFMADVGQRYDVDFHGLSAAAALTPAMLDDLAADDLVEIGSHTVHHVSVRQLPDDVVVGELTESRRWLEECLGRPVRHFAYPYGTARHVDAEGAVRVRQAGYATAVTTRHANVPTVGPGGLGLGAQLLPRLPVDGTRQSSRYLDAVMAGVVQVLKQRVG